MDGNFGITRSNSGKVAGLAKPEVVLVALLDFWLAVVYTN